MVSDSRSKAMVLVVDDDAVARELVAHLLRAGGYDVTAVPNGERALLILCQQGDEIDWLVSKVDLPGLVCGFILKDEYERLHPDRPALLIASPDPARTSPAHAVFIPPAAPVRVLEALQGLTSPDAPRVLPFPSAKAA
ncbi:response regulator [Microvirga sesbaniae]|uniref:response regulator n=1 Tax=Microvirga sesbaniae TaxID=681392 RepID=UPI0021CA24B9|nr:response regulator [Microvirga sp. HBU67692]